MGSIKDRNDMYLTAEDIKKRWQEYTEELYKTGLHNPENHDSVITHLEPDIKLPTSAGSWKKQESSRKTSIFAFLTMPKPLTVWITINCGKF